MIAQLEAELREVCRCAVDDVCPLGSARVQARADAARSAAAVVRARQATTAAREEVGDCLVARAVLMPAALCCACSAALLH